MQRRRQFLRKISRDRFTNERLGSSQQGTVTGETRGRAEPQTIGSETGDLAKSVETAAMKVAGQSSLNFRKTVRLTCPERVSGREMLQLSRKVAAFARNQARRGEVL